MNPNNLIHKYKTEGMIPQDFSNYQNPTNLFKNLRHASINSKEVFKNQVHFKSDLNEIKKGNPNLKSNNQVSVTQILKIF